MSFQEETRTIRFFPEDCHGETMMNKGVVTKISSHSPITLSNDLPNPASIAQAKVGTVSQDPLKADPALGHDFGPGLPASYLLS